MTTVVYESNVKCPYCSYTMTEKMPPEGRQWFYKCPGCRAVVRVKPGEGCVFCAYGSTKCPPVQRGLDCRT